MSKWLDRVRQKNHDTSPTEVPKVPKVPLSLPQATFGTFGTGLRSVSEIFQDPLLRLASEILSWPIERQELWAERAAILEYDAGLSRLEAEQAALTMSRPLMSRNTETTQ